LGSFYLVDWNVIRTPEDSAGANENRRKK